MRLNIRTRGAAIAALSLALGACTTDHWQQWLYGVREGYVCQQADSNPHDRKARSTQCLDAKPGEGRRYEDYKAARDQAISAQP